MRRLIASLVLLCAASPALAQSPTTYLDSPVICSADRTQCNKALPVIPIPMQSTVALNGGTIAASGGTAALTFTSNSDGEVINPSTATLWASWGTPAVNGTNSFAITPNGSYRPPNRVAGTLTLLSTAANQPYTFNKF